MCLVLIFVSVVDEFDFCFVFSGFDNWFGIYVIFMGFILCIDYDKYFFVNVFVMVKWV